MTTIEMLQEQCADFERRAKLAYEMLEAERNAPTDQTSGQYEALATQYDKLRSKHSALEERHGALVLEHERWITQRLPDSTDGKILTRSGELIDVRAIRPEQVKLSDIATALSRINRFTGHTCRVYSVAEHSYWVSKIVDPTFAAEGLMHDASEAYLLDIPAPIKRLPEFAGYRYLEYMAEQVIAKRFKLQHTTKTHTTDTGLSYEPTWPEPVHVADKVMLGEEVRQLMAPHACWAAMWAEEHQPVAAILGDGSQHAGGYARYWKLMFLDRAAELGLAVEK